MSSVGQSALDPSPWVLLVGRLVLGDRFIVLVENELPGLLAISSLLEMFNISLNWGFRSLRGPNASIVDQFSVSHGLVVSVFGVFLNPDTLTTLDTRGKVLLSASSKDLKGFVEVHIYSHSEEDFRWAISIPQ